MSGFKAFGAMQRQALDAMKDQLIIVLIQRRRGSVDIPVAEIDGTGRVNMWMKLNDDERSFHFEVKEKVR